MDAPPLAGFPGFTRPPTGHGVPRAQVRRQLAGRCQPHRHCRRPDACRRRSPAGGRGVGDAGRDRCADRDRRCGGIAATTGDLRLPRFASATSTPPKPCLKTAASPRNGLTCNSPSLDEVLRAIALLRQPGHAALARIHGMGEVLSSHLLHAVLLRARRRLCTAGRTRGPARAPRRTRRDRRLGRQRGATGRMAHRQPATARGGDRLHRQRCRWPAHGAGPQWQRFLGRDLRVAVRCR